MKILLKVSSLSVLAVLCTANVWGFSGAGVEVPGGQDPEPMPENPEIPDPEPPQPCVNNGGYAFYGPGSYASHCVTHICDVGHYCIEDGVGLINVSATSGNFYSCPSNYDNTATGLTSIEECCLNGYDSSTGLCKTGDVLYNDTISESCQVDFLGSSDGDALNSFLAEYTPNTYTVSLHSNYGTDTVLNTVTATYDATMPTASAPSRVGYTFGGFYDATTGGTQYYTSTMASAKTYDKTANTDLYAYWDVNSHTITFSCGTMTGTIANGTATYDSSYTFPTDSACEHTGYTFNGWGCSNDTTYTSGQSLTWNVDSDLTCNAQWTANTITITWDPNNGNDPTTNTCTYDGDITLPTAPEKTGYTFKGWKFNKNN